MLRGNEKKVKMYEVDASALNGDKVSRRVGKAQRSAGGKTAQLRKAHQMSCHSVAAAAGEEGKKGRELVSISECTFLRPAVPNLHNVRNLAMAMQ